MHTSEILPVSARESISTVDILYGRDRRLATVSPD